MNSTILVVHDDVYHCTLVTSVLQRAGYQVTILDDARALETTVSEQRPDLVILDAVLTHADGFALCGWLRNRFPEMGIVFLSERSALADRLAGFERGADDYLARPFEPAELVAHVQAILRRCHSAARNRFGALVRAGSAALDLGTLQFHGPAGDAVALTPTEMRLLECLMSHAGAVVPRERLLDQTWDYDFEGDGNRVTMCIRRLRRKIETDPEHPALIETVRGIGYRFRSPNPPKVTFGPWQRGMRADDAVGD
jgi:DNA-binding response OmpR family regulator